MTAALALTTVAFAVGLLYPGPLGAQQDPPHRSCCFWIYSTGVELGGLKSTAYFGRPSFLLETDMVRLLFEIGNWTQFAHIACSELSRCWNNFSTIQRELDSLSEELTSVDPLMPASSIPGRWPNYPRIYNALPAEKGEFEYGLLDVGRRLPTPPQEQRTVAGFTCESGYFLLGYYVGFALHAFGVAQPEQQSVTGKEARRLGLAHVVRALDLVYSLRQTAEQGGNCAPLWSDPVGIVAVLQEVDQERVLTRLTNAELAARLRFVRYRIDDPAVFGAPQHPLCPGVLRLRGALIARPITELQRRQAALARKWALQPTSPPPPTTAPPPPTASPAPPAPPAPSALGNELRLNEFGFTGKFVRQGGDGPWVGAWVGGCQQSTFRLAGGSSAIVAALGRGEVALVLTREDGSGATCPFSPGLRAEYRLTAKLSGSTIRLEGKRTIVDPGSLRSQAWLKGNVADVSGSLDTRP